MREWGAALMAVLPRALHYVESQGRDVDGNKHAWSLSNYTVIILIFSFTLSIEFLHFREKVDTYATF